MYKNWSRVMLPGINSKNQLEIYHNQLLFVLSVIGKFNDNQYQELV